MVFDGDHQSVCLSWKSAHGLAVTLPVFLTSKCNQFMFLPTSSCKFGEIPTSGLKDIVPINF